MASHRIFTSVGQLLMYMCDEGVTEWYQIRLYSLWVIYDTTEWYQSGLHSLWVISDTTDWYQSGLHSLWVISDTIDWCQSMVVVSLGECVCHACMLVACVSLTLAFHVLVALHNVDHSCSKVFMRNLMLILWNASS